MTEPAFADPIILALDSAGLACSVALAAGVRVLHRRRLALAHGQAEALLPMVDRAMGEAGLAPSSLAAVAATVGPGGFTGIRVGLAAARGIALATGARLVGVTGFEAVAAALADAAASHVGDGHLLIALESRREDLYVQLFDAALRPVASPSAVLPAVLVEHLDHLGALGRDAPLAIAGDAALRAAAALSRHRAARLLEDAVPDAAGVARAALHRWRRGEGEGPVDPLYLRSPDVSYPRELAKTSPAAS